MPPKPILCDAKKSLFNSLELNGVGDGRNCRTFTSRETLWIFLCVLLGQSVVSTVLISIKNSSSSSTVMGAL